MKGTETMSEQATVTASNEAVNSGDLNGDVLPEENLPEEDASLEGDLSDDAAMAEDDTVLKFELTEVEALIHTKIIEAIQGSEDEVKAVVASRLAHLQPLMKLQKEHISLIGMILHMCEEMEVKVTATQVVNMQTTTVEIPIRREGRYTYDLLFIAIANLFKKIKSLNTVEVDLKKQISSKDDKIAHLENISKKTTQELSNLRSVPPLPLINLPYVLCKVVIKEDEPKKFFYITKDLRATKKLAEAARFSTPEKAANFLIELMDDYKNIPIPNLAKYDVFALHYERLSSESYSKETGAKLRQAIDRATHNKA